MTARYETLVFAVNRNSENGTPVTVYAENRREAMSRAKEIGWNGNHQDANARVLKVEELHPHPKESDLEQTLHALRFVLDERERELLKLKGSCSTCSLHYAHAGPCGKPNEVL